MKLKLIIFLSLALILLISCKKKLPYYGLSDQMKEYFVFKQGSYWIYRNDSTGIIDSSYTMSFYSTVEDVESLGVSREFIDFVFASTFLSDFEMGYGCLGANMLTISTTFDTNQPPNQIVGNGPIAYFEGWQPNKDNISGTCFSDGVCRYSNITTMTVNNKIYNNIIYTRIITMDSSTANQHFFIREIYFAKNIGIIKFYEESKYVNVKRSFSLLRQKVIQ